ncbi:MAG: S-layer homology domain-containing protein [Chloroflexia bacterium]
MLDHTPHLRHRNRTGRGAAALLLILSIWLLVCMAGRGGDALVRAAAPGGAVSRADIRHDRSARLDAMPLLKSDGQGRPTGHDGLPDMKPPGHRDAPDLVVQRTLHPAGAGAAPALLQSWSGAWATGTLPPDPTLAVGPSQILQMVNGAFTIWDKQGTLLFGPARPATVWQGFGGACENVSDTTDSVALYDQLADRWVMAELVDQAPYIECLALSATGDPRGAWLRYAFVLNATDLPDYPKLAVWTDGYYLSANLPAGAQPFVFDRTRMLAGQGATMQTLPGGNHQQMLPASLAGPLAPPDGSPAFFLESDAAMHLHRMHVDWTQPSLTTFVDAGPLNPAPFTILCPTTFDCVPQRGTQQKLEGLGGWLMQPLVYRRLADREELAATMSVDTGGGHAGVRWYEIWNPAGQPTLHQQGTYAPDSDNRWMASLGVDHDGNIAMGYTVSGPSTWPALRYAGRLTTDPLGTMPQGEGILLAGSGVQEASNRWGDYSSMVLDPADDCTFWYTAEDNSSSGYVWVTQIGSFRFPSCHATQPPPTATAPPRTATPVPSATPSPSCSISFSDVPPGAYFAGPVLDLACQGVLSGYSDGTFRPFAPATRAQVVKIADAAFHIAEPPPTGARFVDVLAGYTFAAPIEAAASAGIISGYTCGGPGEPCDGSGRPYFRPGADVTRAQLAKIVALAAGWPASAPGLAVFADVPEGSAMQGVVEAAACREVVSGYTCGGPGEPCGAASRRYFRPGLPTTRAQIAKIIRLAETAPPACASP